MSQNTVSWLVENQIVHGKAYDIDASGLAEIMTEANDLVNQSDLPLVHVIWDILDLATYPTKINDIRDAIKHLFTNNRLGWVIVVTDNRMTSFLAQVGSSMYGVRYYRAKTMEEALDYLQDRDPTLASLS